MPSRNRNKRKKLRARARKKLIESTRIIIPETLNISLSRMEKAYAESKAAFMALVSRLPQIKNGF